MADIIELVPAPKTVPVVASPRSYSVDIVQYPDNLVFTVNDISVNALTLRQIADELEKIAQIIRTDVVTGVV